MNIETSMNSLKQLLQDVTDESTLISQISEFMGEVERATKTGIQLSSSQERFVDNVQMILRIVSYYKDYVLDEISSVGNREQCRYVLEELYPLTRELGTISELDIKFPAKLEAHIRSLNEKFKGCDSYHALQVDQSRKLDLHGPDCNCGQGKMVLRFNRKTSIPFWGCGTYPRCHQTRSLTHNEEAALCSH